MPVNVITAKAECISEWVYYS